MPEPPPTRGSLQEAERNPMTEPTDEIAGTDLMGGRVIDFRRMSEAELNSQLRAMMRAKDTHSRSAYEHSRAADRAQRNVDAILDEMRRRMQDDA